VEVIAMVTLTHRAHIRRFPEQAGGRRPALHLVPASAPHRPAWVALYVSVAIAAGPGGFGALAASTEDGRQMAALAMALGVMAAMAVWVRANRVALSRLGEPAAGAGPLALRIVRGRRAERLADERVVRLAPGEPLPPVRRP
jgi:hypothetical protein